MRLLKWLSATACVLCMNTAAAANDLYTVMAQVQNGQVFLSPCTDPEVVWLGAFDQEADERTVREHINKYPSVSAERPHAGFFMRVVAEPLSLADEAVSDAAIARPATAPAQAQFVVREILSLSAGSCHLADLLKNIFPPQSTEAGSPQEP